MGNGSNGSNGSSSGSTSSDGDDVFLVPGRLLRLRSFDHHLEGSGEVRGSISFTAVHKGEKRARKRVFVAMLLGVEPLSWPPEDGVPPSQPDASEHVPLDVDKRMHGMGWLRAPHIDLAAPDPDDLASFLLSTALMLARAGGPAVRVDAGAAARARLLDLNRKLGVAGKPPIPDLARVLDVLDTIIKDIP